MPPPVSSRDPPSQPPTNDSSPISQQHGIPLEEDQSDPIVTNSGRPFQGVVDSITVKIETLIKHPELQLRRSARPNASDFDPGPIQLLLVQEGEEMVQLFTEALDASAKLSREPVEPSTLEEAQSDPNWLD